MALDGRAVVDTGIGDEWGGVDTGVESTASVGDGNGGAVLVHFSLSEMVEPAPTKQGFSRGGVGGKGEFGSETFEQTSSNVGKDDLPGITTVVRHGKLT